VYDSFGLLISSEFLEFSWLQLCDVKLLFHGTYVYLKWYVNVKRTERYALTPCLEDFLEEQNFSSFLLVARDCSTALEGTRSERKKIV
jgi:hypothetical protein